MPESCLNHATFTNTVLHVKVKQKETPNYVRQLQPLLLRGSITSIRTKKEKNQKTTRGSTVSISRKFCYHMSEYLLI